MLTRGGQLVEGRGRRAEMMTTARAIDAERQILAEVDAGRGAGRSYVPQEQALERLAAAAKARSKIVPSPGQAAAGAMLLASSDRIVGIQGVAVAGKSSMLAAT